MAQATANKSEAASGKIIEVNTSVGVPGVTRPEPEVFAAMCGDKPTAEGGVYLGQLLHRGRFLNKNLSSARQDLAKYDAPAPNLASVGQRSANQQVFRKAATDYVEQMPLLRDEINRLNSGTTAAGGANIQSVICEIFGPVSEGIRANMTAADAKKINSRAWGG